MRANVVIVSSWALHEKIGDATERESVSRRRRPHRFRHVSPDRFFGRGGLRGGPDLILGDLALLRQAANQDWRPRRTIRRRMMQVIAERVVSIGAGATNQDARWQLAACRALIAMNGANLRNLGRALSARNARPRKPIADD